MKEPQLNEYGLTPLDLARWEQWEERIGRRIMPPLFGGVMLAMFVGGYREYGGIVGGLVFGLGVGFGLGFFAVILALAALPALASLVVPGFAAFSRYSAARKGYEAWLQKGRSEYWRSLSGVAFEKALAALFESAGYQTHLTPSSGDKGIDIVLTRGGKRILVQCKATAKPVGPAVVRELWGAFHASGGDLAVLASVGGVTAGVREFAKGKPILIFELPQILALHAGDDLIDRLQRLGALVGSRVS